jgi:hypothetical protein
LRIANENRATEVCCCAIDRSTGSAFKQECPLAFNSQCRLSIFGVVYESAADFSAFNSGQLFYWLLHRLNFVRQKEGLKRGIGSTADYAFYVLEYAFRKLIERRNQCFLVFRLYGDERGD